MDLLNEKVAVLFRKFLVPSLFSAASISIFGFVDMLVIGQGVGENGVAAFSILQTLLGVTSFVGVFMGMGTSIPMAIARGEGNREESDAIFTASLLLLSLITVTVWAAFLIFPTQIFTLFGANSTLMPLVMSYGKWIILTLPIFFFAIYMACIVQADGAPGLAMFAVLLGGGFNVFGDWYLVFAADMGMSGAAIATVLGNLIQVLIFTVYIISPRSSLKTVKLRRLKQYIKKICIAGISPGIIDIAYIILTVMLNNQVLNYGTEQELAVFGVAYTCLAMFQRLFGGTGRAVQPIISTNFGGGKVFRIQEALRLSVITEMAMGIIFTLIGLLLPLPLVKLFIDASPELLLIAPKIIRIFFLSFALMGVNLFATYYFQSIMQTSTATIIALLRGLIISGILIVILPILMGIDGIWWGMVLTELVVAVITFTGFAASKQRLSKTFC
ncbi:MAG: polysaccharide biosynthesis C-terminal domain-containing protein [Clostridia bacterium]|nr:polysaccharide biosynthesis C-terminal domain-containing protein [Clostridia bacterium]